MQLLAGYCQSRLVFFGLLMVLLLSWSTSAPAAPASLAVETYHWPPGVFLSFGRLKQAQKDRLLAEIEAKLARLRQEGKSLLVRGELMMRMQPEVAEFNPATILDQSGMVVIVNNFPNIYYKFAAPESLLRRNTAFVLKNPQVDRAESTLRQAVVLRGEFLGFSQSYIQAMTESLEKALAPPNTPGTGTAPAGRSVSRGKNR